MHALLPVPQDLSGFDEVPAQAHQRQRSSAGASSSPRHRDGGGGGIAAYRQGAGSPEPSPGRGAGGGVESPRSTKAGAGRVAAGCMVGCLAAQRLPALLAHGTASCAAATLMS
jgi:hypothetical protein